MRNLNITGFLAFAALAVASLLSCLSGSPLDPQSSGSIYMDVTANYNCRTPDSGCVAPDGGKPIVTTRSGESCTSLILFLFAFGDKSLGAAAENGSVSRVSLVEYSNTAILAGLYRKECLIVYGE